MNGNYGILQMNNKKCDTQTALKLLSQYADEYKNLEVRYKAVTREINDLKSNLQINKEIIEVFCSKISIDKKTKALMDKLRQENIILYQQDQLLLKENKEIKATLLEKDQLLRTQTVNYDKSTEKMRTDLFILENIIKSKDSKITSLKKKSHQEFHVDNNNNISYGNYYEKYITDPSPIVNKLNHELEHYKEITEKLNNHLNSIKNVLMKHDYALKTAQNECLRYKDELNAIKNEKNTNKIISKLGYKHFTQNNISLNMSNGHNKSSNLINNPERTNTIDGLNKSKRTIINNLEEANKSKMKMNKVDIIGEWTDTLKYCNMSQEDYSKFCDNKRYIKLTDAIEYLYKVIVDKNIQIGLLIEENDCINVKNLNLNRLNMELTCELKIIKNNSKMTKKELNEQRLTLLNTFNQPNGKQNDSSIYVNRDHDELYGKKNPMNSITSSEFREGMVLDAFDFTSELSKPKKA